MNPLFVSDRAQELDGAGENATRRKQKFQINSCFLCPGKSVGM